MNNENKTLDIGTIFTYNGNKYKVYKTDYNPRYVCSKCAFNGINCDTIKNIRGKCAYNTRIDGIQVHYEKINNESMNKDNDTKENVIIPVFKDNNSLNNLHIECPKGYLIDTDNSDLSKGIIKFKNDTITFKDIYKDIDINIDKFANSIVVVNNNNPYYNKLEAISQLIDIANYYNKGWKPDWNNEEENKYHIVFDFYYNIYRVKVCAKTSVNVTYFAHEEDAKSVIDNPNFKDILDDIYKN